MSHFNTKIGKDIISVDEMLSKYLWNQTKASINIQENIIHQIH